MALSLCATLLLLGAWAVFEAFLKGDRLRRHGNSVVPRATPRIVTSLGLLGSAGVAGLVDVVREPADKVYPAYGVLALLGLGAGTAVSALRRASPAGRDEAPQPRVTKQGWAALALLLSAQVVAALNDRVVEAFHRMQGPAGVRSVIPGAFALFFLVLGTGGAAWAFLARNTAPGGTVSEPRWATPKPWWALAVLGLAAAALVLTNFILPTPAGLLGLVLLVLGTGAGLFGYLSDHRAKSPGQPAVLRISPRGWVSLGLLALATGAVTLNQTRAWTGKEATDKQAQEAISEQDLEAVRAELARKEAELRSLRTRPTDGRSWDDLRGPDEPGAPHAGENGDARKLEGEVDGLRLKLARLEAGPNGPQPALPSPPPPTVDLATWKWRPGRAGAQDRTGADRARRAVLESEVDQLRAKVKRMEAETNKPQPAAPPAAPTSVDLSTWGPNGRGRRQDTSAAGQGLLPTAVTGRNRFREP